MPDEKSQRRVVYSTDSREACPKCGWPVKDCRCSANLRQPESAVPAKITATLRIENRASGKVVTVIDGLPANRDFLNDVARELKKSCGTGGRTGETDVELQGDHRERLRELLARKGWKVKG
jgi:translation initiation factor 1